MMAIADRVKAVQPPISLSILVGLVFFLLAAYRLIGLGEGEHAAFLGDASYRALAASETLSEEGVYGLHPRSPQPAQTGTLRTLLVSLAGAAGLGASVLSVHAVTLLFGVLSLLVLLQLAHQWGAGRWVVLGVAIAFSLSPGLLVSVREGAGAVFAWPFMLGALLLHVARRRRDPAGVSLAAAVLIGFAAWQQVELCLWWSALVLHALLMTSLDEREDKAPALLRTVVDGLSGVLVLGIVLFPLIARNLSLTGYPWLMSPQADPLPGGGVGALIGGLPQAFSMVAAIPLLGNPLLRLVFWVSVLGLLVAGLFVEKLKPHRELGLLFLIVPVLSVIPALFLGWEGLEPVFMTLQPLAILAVGAFLRDVAPMVDSLVKGRHGLPLSAGRFSFAVLFFLVVLAFFLRGGAAIRDYRESFAARGEAREAVMATIRDEGLQNGPLASDEPGWPAWVLDAPVIDLSGVASPVTLHFLGADVAYSTDELERLDLEAQPAVWILWDAQWRTLFGPGFGVRFNPRGETGPLVIRAGASAGF